MVVASIGIISDTEARVTREVAEATLPYLMEAAGIPGEQRTSKHQAAIISMIYTDEGQQQMVNWVKEGKFSQKLEKAGFKSAEIYKNKAYRYASLASLFPCGTGTFTSFANHKSRLGSHILSDDIKKAEYISKFIQQRNIANYVIGNINFSNFEEANKSFHGKKK